MKKVFAVCLILFVLCLSGCARKPYSFKQPIDDIKSIEIVMADTCLEFQPIKKLTETEREEFLEKFQMLEFGTYYFGDPMSVHGTAVKITYKDDSYEMICYHWSEYVKNGEIYYIRRNCDKNEFNELINCFLDGSR